MGDDVAIHIPPANLGNYEIPASCRDGMCVDVGANVGDFTALAAARFRRVQYYEPYRPCFERVHARMEGQPHVTGYQEAVYAQAGVQVALAAHFNRDAGSLAVRSDLLNADWDVDVGTARTVDFPLLLARAGGRIDYLKCDCETSEYALLMGRDLSAVGFIGLELHWQMGASRFSRLLEHISRTHDTDRWPRWAEEGNVELLFRPRRVSGL